MNNPTLTKSFTAEAAVPKYRIVKFGTTDDVVIQATAVGDLAIGVSDPLGAEITRRCDVILAGVADVEYGGTVVRGTLLTVDASGRAVAAAPAAGTNNRVIGVAIVSGVLGDIGSVYLSPSSVQG